eukprot:7252311-Lingulodinium_polyedra.AAC.1
MAAAVGLAPPGKSSWVAAYSPAVFHTQITATSLRRPTQSGTTVSSRSAPMMRSCLPACASTGAQS